MGLALRQKQCTVSTGRESDATHLVTGTCGSMRASRGILFRRLEYYSATELELNETTRLCIGLF